MTEAEVVFEAAGVSTEALASLGEGHIAYVKQFRSEDVPGLFPESAEDRAGSETVRAPCRGRNPDHADRQPGSCGGEPTEQ